MQTHFHRCIDCMPARDTSAELFSAGDLVFCRQVFCPLLLENEEEIRTRAMKLISDDYPSRLHFSFRRHVSIYSLFPALAY